MYVCVRACDNPLVSHREASGAQYGYRVSCAPSDATQGGARADPLPSNLLKSVLLRGHLSDGVIIERKWHARSKDARNHARHPAHL
jgi:hypothetical protein